MSNGLPVHILYTNYKGETAWRKIIPLDVFWGSTEYHPENQLLLEATDLDKNQKRTFAVKDIQATNDFIRVECSTCEGFGGDHEYNCPRCKGLGEIVL